MPYAEAFSEAAEQLGAASTRQRRCLPALGTTGNDAPMPEDFVVARNPDPDSRLPYLLRIPLGRDGVVVAARDTWPRTAAVYCHPATAWPPGADVVERVGTRSCLRRGAAIDLVLDRGRENRSQFVFTTARGRPVIFWQTARVTRKARPGVATPTARAHGIPQLDILIDVQEKYPYRFTSQQAQTVRQRLTAGDYGIEIDGRLVASVERKSLADLVTSLVTGKLAFALAELAALPRAAVVVEDRYSRVFGLDYVRPATVADGLAEVQVRWPNVPIVFAETRKLATEWTYRYLAAAFAELSADPGTALSPAGPLPPGPLRAVSRPAGPPAPRRPTSAEIRAWALATGIPVADRGRLRQEILGAYRQAHPPTLAEA